MIASPTLIARAEAEMAKLGQQIEAERARHEGLGWTAQHDRGHGAELRAAAECYYDQALLLMNGASETWPWPMDGWPWHSSYWKPSKDPRRNLVKCGALRLAADDADRASSDVGAS